MANEMRLIDANAMREDWLENGQNEYVYDTNAVLGSIDAQPTVDAVEAVHARWIDEGDGDWRCSDCKMIFALDAYGDVHPKYDGGYNYCPNCGATMDVREKLIDERVELCDIICCAMRDWDDYMDECRETETPPIDSFEDFIADGVISAGYRKQEWISVKDRLPQDDLPFGGLCEIVQVLLDDGTVTVGWCNRGLKGWYYLPIQAANFVGNDYDKTPVIAWQPLAQPPKGE